MKVPELSPQPPYPVPQNNQDLTLRRRVAVFHREQKRVNTEDLRGYHLTRLAPAGVWELGSSQQLSAKGGSLCLLCANNALHTEHLLSSWGSGILGHARQRAFMWPAPSTNLGRWVSTGLPWAETSHACCSWERMCSVGPHGRESMGRLQWVPPDPACVFPFWSSCASFHHCNKSQPWVKLQAESCASFYSIFEWGGGPEDPNTYPQCLNILIFTKMIWSLLPLLLTTNM